MSLLLAGCGDAGPKVGGDTDRPTQPSGQGSPTPATVPPHGFATWHEDFPGAPQRPHLSPRIAGRTYDRTRGQALEKVIDNLRGACSRDAWLFARDLCGRLDPADAPPMIEALDRALTRHDGADHVENILHCLSLSAQPRAAESILRALGQPREAVQTAALLALAASGTPDTVRSARGALEGVTTRGIKSWAMAASKFLPAAEIIDAYRQILADARYYNIHSPVADAALLLPLEQALAVFEPFGDDLPDLVRPKLLVLRYSAGDEAAEIALRQALRSTDPQARRGVVGVLAAARVDDFQEELLLLSDDADPAIRVGVVPLLGRIASEGALAALDTLGVDDVMEVRRAALAELVRLGRRGVLDDLINEVRTAHGSRMRVAIEDLVAAKDPSVIPVLAARLKQAPDLERTDFLRAIALTTRAEAFEPMWTIFESEEPWAAAERDLTALLMANARGAELKLLEAFRRLPSADYRRRGLILSTLASVAVDREDDAIRRPIFAEFRRILGDASELPQMRLLALEMLRRDLSLADQEWLRGLSPKLDSALRAAVSDFLFEFF
ncbi:MAG: HEAT repeat domain-containing protein [Planctomycetota bacterium]